MKALVLVLLSALSLSAAAKTYEFKCELQINKGDGELIFQVNNPYGKASYELAYTDYDGNPVAFSYSGEKLEWYWLHILGSHPESPATNSNGDLIVEIDNEDCAVGKLQLYKNSAFSAGFLKIEDQCDGQDPTYTKVSCTAKAL